MPSRKVLQFNGDVSNDSAGEHFVTFDSIARAGMTSISATPVVAMSVDVFRKCSSLAPAMPFNGSQALLPVAGKVLPLFFAGSSFAAFNFRRNAGLNCRDQDYDTVRSRDCGDQASFDEASKVRSIAPYTLVCAIRGGQIQLILSRYSSNPRSQGVPREMNIFLASGAMMTEKTVCQKPVTGSLLAWRQIDLGCDS